MNRRFLTLGLPVLGAVLIAGIGYSAWVFSNEMTAKASANGTVTVTAVLEDKLKVDVYASSAATGGDLLATSDTSVSNLPELKLELDQGGYSNLSNVNAGITWQYGSGTSWTDLSNIRLDVSYDDNDFTVLSELFENHTLSLSYTVTLKFGTDTNVAYVVMAGDTDTPDGVITGGTTADLTGHTDGALHSFTGINVGLSYVAHSGTGGKPQTQDEHDAMKTALGMTGTQSGEEGTNTVTLEVEVKGTWNATSN